jgi:OOP family OmpA-OmpF porin
MYSLLKNPKKLALAVVGAVIAYLVLARFGFVPGAFVQKSVVPTAVELSKDAPVQVATHDVAQVPLPTTTVSKVGGPLVRINIWAWNAQMGLIYANGGPQTTAGSLMEKHGARVNLIRQDETEKSKPEQIKFANALAGGDSNPADGIHFVVIMGDGAAQYLAAVNKALVKLGPDYKAEIVGAVGYSRGEDAFMGPQDWKDNPEAARGGVVSGVLRDGDWNIAQFWAGQNGIRNNPDPMTFDPTALNWVSSDDYVKAAEMYISNYCEDRDVVKDGKKTGEKKHVCVQGTVTWTPGDVNVAKKRGGLVKILSTKENLYQMPAVLIGIHQWNVAHKKQVEAILGASFDAADQIRSYDDALQRAGKASYAVYAEESPAYWVKYYKGVVERDKQQMPVPLGGSTVANLGDNLVLFGIAEGAGGASSLFKATYEGFGNVAKQQYPSLVPSFPKTEDAVNLTFLQELQATAPTSKPSVVAEFDSTPAVIDASNVVAKRNWTIQFDTGKASFTLAAQQTLDDLYNQLAIGAGLTVEIDGHTDNVGNPVANQALSLARANAVRTYLQSKSSTIFPAGRVFVQGFGDAQPIAPNTTEPGRAQNRRVAVILGTK